MTGGKCPHCGGFGHAGVCHMIKAIEYHPDGTIRRVEYKTASDFPQVNLPSVTAPQPTTLGVPMTSVTYG